MQSNIPVESIHHPHQLQVAMANERYDVDYSPSATVIPFPRPLPLLRTPVPSLAFSSPSSFSSALSSARRTLLSQCHSSALLACSLSASSRCRPPFWRPSSDFAERARCEERETASCFHAAKDRCAAFVEDKCRRGFQDAIVVVGAAERKVNWREVGRLGLFLSGRDLGLKRLATWAEVRQSCFITTCRGSDLFADGFPDQ